MTNYPFPNMSDKDKRIVDNIRQQSTAELQRRLAFQERDLTETIEQEVTRMFLIQEITRELNRRKHD
jgi:hypothetical protein